MAQFIASTMRGFIRAIQASLPSEDQQRQQDGKDLQHEPFDASPIDVLVARAMLCKGKKLPPELVDSILDFAEYWAHSWTEMITSHRIMGGHSDREDKFLLRSFPLGLAHVGKPKSEDTEDFATTQVAPQPLSAEVDPSAFANTVAYPPLPKLAHPARKVVFTIRSRDQGFATDETSWTWFEAGLERFGAQDDECGQAPHQEGSSLPSVHSLRPVHPSIERSASNPHEYKYHFPLLHAPEWEIQRNKVAENNWHDYVVTWSYLDDTQPDSEGGQALEAQGRGRATGDGEYVRNLRIGDVITVWGKARFGAWVNRVEYVRVDVYWAV